MKSLRVPLFSAGLLALSAVSLPAAVAVLNGGFEDNAAGYVVWPGYSGSVGVNTATPPSNPAAPAGWTVSGSVGVNNATVISTDSIISGQFIGAPVNPFADNGQNTGSVAFLQGNAWIEQTIAGFVTGGGYVLSFDINARGGTATPEGTIYLNGTQVVPWTAISPVGDSNPYLHFDLPFQAPTESITIRFESRPQAAGTDASLLLDNVAITAVPEPAAAALLLASLAAFGRRRRSDG